METHKKERYLKMIALIVSGIGIVCILYGILMEVFQTIFPNMRSAPRGFGLLGALVLILALAPWLEEKTKTKRQQIEEEDERNLSNLYQSCFHSYSFLVGAGILALLFLTMLGYMNKVSFFTLCTIFIVSYFLQYIIQHILRKKM